MRLIFVPSFGLEAAAPSAKGCDNAFAIEFSLNALPTGNGFSYGRVDVGLPETAGFADVWE